METFNATQIGYLIVTLGIPVTLGALAFAVLAIDDLLAYLRDRR